MISWKNQTDVHIASLCRKAVQSVQVERLHGRTDKSKGNCNLDTGHEVHVQLLNSLSPDKPFSAVDSIRWLALQQLYGVSSDCYMSIFQKCHHRWQERVSVCSGNDGDFSSLRNIMVHTCIHVAGRAFDSNEHCNMQYLG